MEGSNSNSPHTAEYDGPHQYGSSPEKTIDLSASDTIAMFQQMMHKMDDMYAIMHKQADEITELKQKQELPPDAEPAAAKAQKLAPSAGAVDEEKEAAEEADGNLPPSSKRMKPITLGSFSGAKYDGTLATYPDWTSDIENKLQTHQALGVLDDNQYQGRYLNNARITAGPALDDLISTGEDLQSVVGAFLVQSLSGSILTRKMKPCKYCAEGKMSRQIPHRDPDRLPREFEPGEAVTMDTTKIMPETVQGATVGNLCMDRGTHYMRGQLLADKKASTLAAAIRSYIVRSPWGMMSEIHVDGGPEYQGEVEALCESLNIWIQHSASNTHEQNPIETQMRIVGQGTRCSFLSASEFLEGPSGVPEKQWGMCWLDTIDAKNTTWTKSLKSGITPYEAEFGRRPDISMRRPFYCPARVLIHSETGSLAPRAYHGHYVRLAVGYKAWQIWVPDLESYVISRHVTFDELPRRLPRPQERRGKTSTWH